MRKIPPPYTDPTPLFRHGGATRRGGQPLLDFSASINPLGPPESVLRVLRDHLPDIAHYPDPECRELTELLARMHGVPAECVLVGNGSNELIYAIARALRPKRVAIAEPTYTEYLRASLLVGAEVDHWLAEGENFTVEPFEPGAVDLVWLCNPNNPTASSWPFQRTTEWMKEHPTTFFVIDEAFMPFQSTDSYEWGIESFVYLSWWLTKLSNVLILRSMTKWFSCPGLRLGYVIAHPDLIVRIAREVVPWSVSCLAQVAGVAALQDVDFQDHTETWMAKTYSPFGGSPTFAKRAQATGSCLSVVHSWVNFVLVRFHNTTARELTAQLVDYGIAIRDASNFVGLDEHYVRIAVRLPEENERLFAALKEILT
jgi:threonine-phosphate decarboxylase